PTTTPNQHPDHVAIGGMVRDAARVARFGGVPELREQRPHEIAQLLHYAITVEAEPGGALPTIFDVSDEAVMQRWTSAMEAHASQHATRNYVELQLTRARLLGLRAGCAHAWPLFPNDPLVFESLQPLGRAARRF
ncbi:MAG TPA: hypothetical protein VHF69_05365, partial [Candidatus Synoicihabitans sp.]|nr:hypothetical protein [Candidatus Synoicihabitans sp.]